MSIESRLKFSPKGFSILQESGKDRKPYYGVYTLRETPDFVPRDLQQFSYWDALNAFEVTVPGPGCFVYVCEKEGDEVVESHRFYWSSSSKKPTLQIGLQSDRRYGPNAYVITIDWIDSNGEAINNHYIFVRSREGDKYRFRKKFIEPMESLRDVEAKFVYSVPEGDRPDNYTVDILPELREKYNVRFTTQ